MSTIPPLPPLNELRRAVADLRERYGHLPNDGGEPDELYIDVAAALAGDLKPVEPDAGSQRSDGMYLLYAGKVNVLMGDPESGKTLVALAMGVDTLRRGGSFAILDLDHNGTVEILTRMLSFGADPEHLADRSRFRLAMPESEAEYMALLQDITAWCPDVVLIDSIGELGAVFNRNLNRDEDFAPLNRTAIQPFATAGSAVITVDHMAKNANSRAFGAGGTIRKKAAVNGASYEVSLAGAGFTRSLGGRSYLRLKKDRPGGVRDRSPAEKDPLVAEFVLSPPSPFVDSPHSTWVFRPGAEVTSAAEIRKEARAVGVKQDVLDHLAENARAKTGDLRAVLSKGGMTNNTAQTDLLRQMVDDRLITFDAVGKSNLYSLVEP
ncbi:AAA family ATPase [Microbacterium lacticum]